MNIEIYSRQVNDIKNIYTGDKHMSCEKNKYFGL